MVDLLLGIDVGTTFCKAAAVAIDGREVGHGRCATPWRQVRTGAEIDPRALADAAIVAVRQAREGAPPGRVIGIGVTSMGETGVLLNAQGQPAAPGIAWHDTRGEKEAAQLTDELGAASFTATTGLPLTRSWTVSKYRWLRTHHPETGAGRRWLSVAEWIVRALGGEETAELSLATRTGLLDIRSRTWWKEALASAGMPEGMMPPLVQAGTPAGRASDALPELDGATLTVAGHDHLAAAVGAGAIDLGVVLDSCGTAEALVRGVPPHVRTETIAQAVASGLTVGWHVIPDRQTLLGFFNCGLAFARFLKLLGVENEGVGRAELDEAANAAPSGAGGLLVDGLADGVATLSGIRSDASPGLVWRAVLEAGARETVKILTAFRDVEAPAEHVVMVGGWARSPAVRAVKREVQGEFDYPAVVEAGCRGAALLGGCAAGVYAGVYDVPKPERQADH